MTPRASAPDLILQKSGPKGHGIQISDETRNHRFPIKSLRACADGFVVITRITAIMMVVTIALLARSAHAITIRHDVADASYLALAGNSLYRSVGELIVTTGSGGARGSGTLIGSNWVLTAAHVVDDALSVTFNTYAGHSYTATSWIVHSSWTGSLSAGWDMALVQLSSPITTITPANLFDGSTEVGYLGTMVGYGRTGTGSTGDTLDSGTRRAGQNMIDGHGGGVVGSLNLAGWSDRLFWSDFDSPSSTLESLMGANTPLSLEASIAPGDSGGGTFIEVAGTTYLAGVHSLGASIDGSTNSDYGDIFASTRVSRFLDWIATNTGIAPGGGGGALPEPQSLCLLALAGLCISITSRRRSC